MTLSAWRTALLAAVSFAIAFFACFGGGLRGDRQFGYRDAAHFYYPLYERVQREWNEGRWPLWEPEENAGMPLLGNPTAAVLYPGKLIYAALPYPWAARIYILAHVALAFASMLVTLRGWGISGTGSALGALTYAFGAPVLFQYCNIIYLVGAAWLPLGFLAVDRWLTTGSGWALLGLAFVLAMQTLGGDPQASYLLGLCAGGYAAGLAWARSRPAAVAEAGPSAGGRAAPRNRGRWWVVPLVVGLVLAWSFGTVILADLMPRFREKVMPVPALPWMPYVSAMILGAWGLVGIIGLTRWLRGGRRGWLGRALFGLAAAAGLAAGLAAAQLLPVLEFTRQTSRAEGEGPHDIYPFSIAPHRVVEAIWPGVLGSASRENDSWGSAIKIPGSRQKIWVPSNYLGLLGLLLAISVFGLRGVPARKAWLSGIVLVSLLGSLGEYASPIWAARAISGATGMSVGKIGPQDDDESTAIRQDGYLRDGDGGFYWLMTTLLPGFKQFRYPAKLLTFTTFGLAALAGMGWDEMAGPRRRRVLAMAVGICGLSVLLLAIAWLRRGAMVGWLEGQKLTSIFGPIDAQAAHRRVILALLHGGVLAAVLATIAALRDRRGYAGILGGVALLAAGADLAVANSPLVAAVPQALFEGEPEVVRLLREAEAKDPSPGPYRIHRMPIWNPIAWMLRGSPDRVADFVAWERSTIQPKYGINLGIEYAYTKGVAELFELEFFYGGFMRAARGQLAKELKLAEGTPIVVYPRRAFDLWNSRYFVLPSQSNGWKTEERGYASMLEGTERVYPPPSFFRGKANEDEQRDWVENHDFQILKNLQALPRGWVVRESRPLPTMDRLSRMERGGPMQEILHAADLTWKDPNIPVIDPRRTAWIRGEDVVGLRPYLNGMPQKSSETVKVTYPRPDRVEVEANLDAPGLVVLSDVYYPGWTLTIDGKPAPVYKVNVIMRGAAVDKGTHKLSFRYEPGSFRVGGWITIASLGLAALIGLALSFRGPSRKLLETA